MVFSLVCLVFFLFLSWSKQKLASLTTITTTIFFFFSTRAVSFFLTPASLKLCTYHPSLTFVTCYVLLQLSSRYTYTTFRLVFFFLSSIYATFGDQYNNELRDHEAAIIDSKTCIVPNVVNIVISTLQRVHWQASQLGYLRPFHLRKCLSSALARLASQNNSVDRVYEFQHVEDRKKIFYIWRLWNKKKRTWFVRCCWSVIAFFGFSVWFSNKPEWGTTRH